MNAFISDHLKQSAQVSVVIVTKYELSVALTAYLLQHKIGQVVVKIPNIEDPIHKLKHIAVKMLLNAHSTAVMCLFGRVVGNTMTSVSPSNLKLIGRATNLILQHVNAIIKEKIEYQVAN